MKIQEFNYSVAILSALLWEYNDADVLQELLQSKQDWYDVNQTAFWTDWYTDVFNLETANAFGLAVWAIILGLPLDLADVDTEALVFGFGSETPGQDNGFVNFDNGILGTHSGEFDLTVEQQRIVLLLRYFQLTNRAAIPEANKVLKYVFRNLGPVYIQDHLNMSIRVVFKFGIEQNLLTAIKKYDLIPRGAGVKIQYLVRGGPVFGFGSLTNGFVNFNNGPLGAYS